MLHLKSHHIRLLSSRGLQLSPVASEDDELIHAIEDSHEEAWRLEATSDSRSLTEFWNGVEEDLAKDPTWFSFAGDDE